MPKYYAGIGPRKGLPPTIATKMEQLGARFAREGLILRSGSAIGADSAFERGCDSVHGQKQIFLPHKLYNNHPSQFFPPPLAAYELIDLLWSDVKERSHLVRSLFARNCQQIMGVNLDEPAEFVACWTHNGKPVGGTGRAMQVAKYFNIPVVNLKLDLYALDLIEF